MSRYPLPALLGGPPVRPEGPPRWPLPDPDVRTALERAYADGSWGQYVGGNVERLESRLAEYHGGAGVLVCSSGTLAVELALRGLKVGPGDEVILAAYDYPGNFLAVHAVGARPVLTEVAAENWNLDPAGLAAAISPATRAIIVSHLHGGLVPMREVMDLATARGLKVVEDAAQSPGAEVQGQKAGVCGDVGVLSFGGSKLLTAGRGGVILSRHADVLQRVRTWSFRGNQAFPLSELQAAVLLPQVDHLDERNAVRADRVRRLFQRLADVPGLRPFKNGDVPAAPGYYKVGFQYDAAAFGMPRERFLAALRAEGIAFDRGFDALHIGRSPQRFRSAAPLPEAERAHAGSVILHHPVLLGSEMELDQVAEAVRKIQAHAALLSPESGSSGTGPRS